MKRLARCFGKTKLVRIDEKLSRPSEDLDRVYDGKDLLYIDRGEDYYAHDGFLKAGTPFIVVRREDFVRGKLVAHGGAR